ncbi:hypothetical protein BC567DRAFT_259018 [Phyllosticta citribraziliensis]
MGSSRRPEQEGSSPTQPRQSRSNGVRGTQGSTYSYDAYDADGDEGATFSQNMHAVARAIETRATADMEYFNGLRGLIREDKRKNLEAIAEWEKQTETADNGYLERLREPLTTAMEPPVMRGRARKRSSNGAETVGAAGNPKKWKASSANTLAVSRELLHDYDLIERRLQHSTKGVSKKRLGRSWRMDAEEAKRLVGIGYEKAQCEIADVTSPAAPNLWPPESSAMVKADPKRNYYADLEVAPDADADDIRKQFRKLALKWHPDRNPGKEQECVPRFQAIQAAHEILGDPGERTRYDMERRKRGFYGAASTTTNTPGASRASAANPPRPNPYQAYSNFPPPPRRTGPQRAHAPPPKPEQPSTASQGASRFANFPKPPPTAQKPGYNKDNAQSKANVFTAWESMRQKQQRASAGPRPMPTDDFEARFERAEGSRSAWDQFNRANQSKPGMGRSTSTRMPKKGGFDPATPGADEPPAASTSAYQRSRPVPPPPPPPRQPEPTGHHPPPPPPQNPPPQRESQQHQDPLKNFKAAFVDDPLARGHRTRTPYGSAGGEKIFIDPQRRAESQRNSPQNPGTPTNASGTSTPNMPSGRPRSASPPRRRRGKGNATRPFTMYSSSDSEEDFVPNWNQKPTPNQNAQKDGPSPDVNGSPGQSGNATNANVNGGEGPKSQPSMYDTTPPVSQFKSKTPSSKKPWPYWAIPSSVTPPSSSSAASTFFSASAGGNRKRQASNGVSPVAHKSQRPDGGQQKGIADFVDSFNFQIDPDAFEPTKPAQQQPKSKSSENINTTFSPGDWHGKFEGSTDYFGGPVPPASSRRSPVRRKPSNLQKTGSSRPSRSNSTFSPSPARGTSQPRDHSSAPTSATAEKPPTAGFGPVKFSQDEWAKTFKDPSFFMPNEPPKSTSPLKNQPPPRKTKQPRSRTKTRQASVAEEDGSDDVEEIPGTAREANTAEGDGSAMDIDSTPPTSAPANGATEPKPVYVHHPEPAQKKQTTESARAADGGDTIRLDDLKNVAPLSGFNQEGLKNLNDLGQNLPFQSQPAAAHPRRSSEAGSLRLPDPPRAPELPQRLTVVTWTEFLPKMGTYVRLFQQFDSHMLQHFAARQAEVDAMGSASQWLGALGDTTAGGFASYMRGMREDERARAHWTVAWEKHKATMELFQGCRVRVLKGVPAA